MRQTTIEKIEEIKKRQFGVEVEMYNIRRRIACEKVAEYFHTEITICNVGGSYNKWTCDDNKGRKWCFISDSSICDSYDGCEMVTPLLTYDDMNDLQAITRILRKEGGRSDPENNCGVHVHVDVADMTAHQLVNLTNLVASHEQLIKDAISVDEDRNNRWCRSVEPKFLERINREKPNDLDKLKYIWYDSQGYSVSEANDHYSHTRYHLLNFHSLWQNKGIEFRCFQFANRTGARMGGLHAGELKAFIQLCLALCETAKQATSVKSKPSKLQTDNPQFAMKRFMRKLGLKGKEFSTVRNVMFRNLDGDLNERHITVA